MKYWKNGWYLEFNKPDKSIEVTQAEYERLMEGQSKGLQIQENEQGYPILVGTLVTEEEQQVIRAKSKELHEKQLRLTALSQDIVQSWAGELVPNLAERKAEFITLHNEIRVLENKEKRIIEEK